MSAVLPYKNFFPLVGHEEAQKLFLKAYNKKALHHGWLITGPKGIGKATLAHKIARFLLTEQERTGEALSLNVSPDNPIVLQMAEKSHPDFKVLEKDFIETDKKKLLKAIKDGEDVSELKDSLKRSAYIKVEDVRGVSEFLSKKSFNNGWRVVLVDSVDDLNASSANAILKILEEPPLKSILLLISHNPEKLLPTIRSRCARLSLNALGDNEVQSLLRRYAPDLEEREIKGLSEIAGGSIGRALNYYENEALSFYQNIKDFCFKGGKNGELLLEIANQASATDESFDLFAELMCRFARLTLNDVKDKPAFYQAYEKTLKILDETKRLNMEKKQASIEVLSLISANIA